MEVGQARFGSWVFLPIEPTLCARWSSGIPIKAGDRIKTDRRDAVMLARLHRAGELTGVWVPDAAHEAMRDLVRARATAMKVLSKARQHLGGFLLRHGRIYSGVRTWT
jgi:transposase